MRRLIPGSRANKVNNELPTPHRLEWEDSPGKRVMKCIAANDNLVFTFLITGAERKNAMCPDCVGSGLLLGMFPKYVENKSGPPVVELKCDRCGGSGKVPNAMLEWMEIGRRCKAVRIKNRKRRRDVAAEYGIKLLELCRIESGKVDPTEHAQRLGVLDKN